MKHYTSTCGYGAIVSRYFFAKPEEGKIILDKFKTADAAVLSKMLGPSQYAWYINRPDPTNWISYLESLPDDVFLIHNTHFSSFRWLLGAMAILTIRQGAFAVFNALRQSHVQFCVGNQL